MSEQTTTPRLTDQFAKAMVYAERKHHTQVRKGGDIPYVGHLLSVAGLVINDNGSEAQAIAALLHDAVEDAGGPETLREVKAEFGDEVARIVEECSDTDKTPKPPWRERKQDYWDYHEHGPALWQRFTVKNPDDHLWYYGELLDAYRRRGCRSWMIDELGRVVEELKSLVES
jgi:hypothetical protein